MKRVINVFQKENIPFVENEPLKDWCTFQIGGPARIFAEPATAKDVSIIIKSCKEYNVPLLVLGRGSNILFGDYGYDGVVLHLGKNFAHMEVTGDNQITCQSGALLTDLCRFALEEGFSGMEELYGIPGSVGGAVFMNAGAYGGETKVVAMSSSYVDTEGNIGELTIENMDMSYRHSAYTDNGWIITGLTVDLEEGNREEIKANMNDFMNRRRTKQPLEYPSGGSTFKRPVGHYASALIDETGLKGARVGDAMVSEKHAGFVINVGEATCSDVLGLIDHVKKEVMKQKGVQLETEVILIGVKKRTNRKEQR